VDDSAIMKKQDAQKFLDRLPEEFDAEQLMNYLYLTDKLERAEQAIAEGRVFSHDEVVRFTNSMFRESTNFDPNH
jgi:hypothetical protein